MNRHKEYYAVDLERQDRKIAVRRLGSSISSVHSLDSSTAYAKTFGRFNCPKCGITLYLGQKMHVCNAWLLYGQGLDRYQRELVYQRERAKFMTLCGSKKPYVKTTDEAAVAMAVSADFARIEIKRAVSVDQDGSLKATARFVRLRGL